MVVLYVDTKQFMFEDHELEKAFDFVRKAVYKGKPVQIIPDGSAVRSKEDFPQKLEDNP